jgi:hypothetical protein
MDEAQRKHESDIQSLMAAMRVSREDAEEILWVAAHPNGDIITDEAAAGIIFDDEDDIVDDSEAEDEDSASGTMN